MFASEKLVAALNQQVGNEMQASLQYVSIASYLAAETLPELARVFFQQSDEEREHAMRFVHFIGEIGGRVRMPDIPALEADLTSVEQCVALALESERTVTEQVNELVEIAVADSNRLALNFLDFFVTEQLEEVNKMASLLTLVRRAGADGLHFVEDYLSRQGSGSGT